MVLDTRTVELRQVMPKVLEAVVTKIGQMVAAPESVRGSHKTLQRLKHMVKGVAGELYA
jgi:hypothetical protein